MKDSPFRLQDRSVLIYGDFNSLSQGLIREFTEYGADIGFINTASPGPARFLENINDTREAHPEFGRAVQIPTVIKDKSSAFEAVSRMAELFGRIDVVVDLKMQSLSPDPCDLESSRFLLEEVEPFFKSKKKGRIVFLREDETTAPFYSETITRHHLEKFLPWMRGLVEQWTSPHFGVNCVTVGFTEDLLLKRYPQSASIRKTMDGLQKEFPGLQLIDVNEVAPVVLFLSSPASCGLTGQMLSVARSSRLTMPGAAPDSRQNSPPQQAS